MQKIILIEPQEFWAKQQEIVRTTIREELSKGKNLEPEPEDVLSLDDICKLLKKSKQTIYNWMGTDVIKGHYLNESLFFLRSEILELIRTGKKDNKEKL